MSVNKSETGLIRICRKAGKLKCGMNEVKRCCESKEARMVFTARGLSEKSVKEIKFCCEKNGIECVELSVDMEQLAETLGKRTGILAVTDTEFAKAIKERAQTNAARL
ncbi:MAG: ribosomal L7Ae/L30e/S12e/Gadd45 family protein [Ruminococcus sp.]|nr:ribosomal L7Ae/L30e/S12e/Gadd45 family protein [Ruminococcus sp.]